MKLHLIALCLILLCGCSSLKGTAEIKVMSKGVKFESSRPAKMSMEKDGVIYSYDSQAPSLMNKIMGAITLGTMGGRR